MKKKSYGVLMGLHRVSENIGLFHPLYLIAGRDTGEEFEDIMKDYYKYSTDSDAFVLDQNGLSIAYIISEDELKSRYEGSTIEEAKANYFSEINESIHVGYYLVTEDKVVIKSYNVEDLFERLVEPSKSITSSTTEEQDFKKSIPALRIKRPSIGEIDTSTSLKVDELIPITVTDFKKMLDIREEDKLRAVIQSMYDQFKNGYLPVTVTIDENEIYPTLENQEVTGKKIVSFFVSICNKMLTASSLDQISKLETNAKNGLMQAVTILDTHGDNEIAAMAAEETFYRIIDEFAMITSSSDVARIKLDIADVLKNEMSEIERVAKIYDEYEEKFNKNLESKMKSNRKATTKSVSSKLKVNARSLKEFFDRRIAGQEDAKKTIISAIVMNGLSEKAGERNSCFFVGPPGSGKTLMAETLGEYLDIPYVIVDSTQLTSAGYVGRDIEDFLSRLIVKAGGDLKKAEEGIVVFDELDKKGSDKKSDISGKAVLNALLPFFQGTDYEVTKGKDRVTFNTSRLTIFATGACVDIAKAKLQKEGICHYKTTKIGFCSDTSSEEKEEDFVYPKLEPEDFSKYGGIPDELIGRITTICQLSGHTVETLKFILTNIESSTLLALQKNLAKIGITVSWTEDYLSAVANRAIKLKTGARSLKSTVESSIKEARWEVLMNPEKYSGILLTAESVEDPLECKLLEKSGKVFTVREATSQEEVVEKVKKIGAAQ